MDPPPISWTPRTAAGEPRTRRPFVFADGPFLRRSLKTPIRHAKQKSIAGNLVKLRGRALKNYEVVTQGTGVKLAATEATGPEMTSGPRTARQDLLWLGCFAFAFPHEMGEQRTAHAAATQKAASDEKPKHAALAASAFVVLAFAFAFVLVFVFIVAALAEEMEEDRPTNTATTQYPAANQKSQDPAMIFVFALVFIVNVVFVFVLVPLLTPLAQEVGKKQTADPAAAQQAASNEELQDTMLLIAALLALVAKIVAFLATALTKQAREKQAPHPPTAQAAADHHFLEF